MEQFEPGNGGLEPASSPAYILVRLDEALVSGERPAWASDAVQANLIMNALDDMLGAAKPLDAPLESEDKRSIDDLNLRLDPKPNPEDVKSRIVTPETYHNQDLVEKEYPEYYKKVHACLYETLTSTNLGVLPDGYYMEKLVGRVAVLRRFDSQFD
jgi:hypothetical protein